MISYFIGCDRWTPGTKHRCLKINQQVDLRKLKEMFDNGGRIAEVNVSLLIFFIRNFSTKIFNINIINIYYIFFKKG